MATVPAFFLQKLVTKAPSTPETSATESLMTSLTFQITDYKDYIKREDCNGTLDLILTPWFWTGEFFHLALAIPAILLNFVLICLIYLSHLHSNVRLILIHLSIWCIFASGYLGGKGLYTFLVGISNDQCDLKVSLLMCKLQEIVLLMAEFVILGSIFGLGIERAFATRRVRSSREEKDSSVFGQNVLLFLWSVSVVGVVLGLFAIGKLKSLPYCNLLFTFDYLGARIICFVLLGIELFSVVLYAIVWYVNRQRWRSGYYSRYSLNYRLNRKRNVQVVEMMLPSVILHAVCWTLILLFAVAQVHLVQYLTTKQQLLISEFLFHNLALFHMTVHPMVCLWNSDVLRREARDCCPFCFASWLPQKTTELPAPAQLKLAINRQQRDKTKAKNAARRASGIILSGSCSPELHTVYGDNTETHFDLLNTMWDKPEPKKHHHDHHKTTKNEPLLTPREPIVCEQPRCSFSKPQSSKLEQPEEKFELRYNFQLDPSRVSVHVERENEGDSGFTREVTEYDVAPREKRENDSFYDQAPRENYAVYDQVPRESYVAYKKVPREKRENDVTDYVIPKGCFTGAPLVREESGLASISLAASEEYLTN